MQFFAAYNTMIFNFVTVGAALVYLNLNFFIDKSHGLIAINRWDG